MRTDAKVSHLLLLDYKATWGFGEGEYQCSWDSKHLLVQRKLHKFQNTLFYLELKRILMASVMYWVLDV